MKVKACSVFSVSINPEVELIRNSFGGILGNLSAFRFLRPAVPGGFKYAGSQSWMGDERVADPPESLFLPQRKLRH